jgi:4'-phosphopantetheinyl transferase EntD
MRSEATFVERAVPKRREEFARGRAAARVALGELGLPPVAIHVGRERQPLWPPGIVGSITHCAELAWAVVAPAEGVTAIGVDVEPDRSLPEDVRLRVLDPTEALAVEEAVGRDTVGFGVKECVHKAIHPATGVWLDFHDVRVVPEPGEGALRALRVEPSHPALPESVLRLLAGLQIRWMAHGGLVFTSAWVLPAPGVAPRKA